MNYFGKNVETIFASQNSTCVGVFIQEICDPYREDVQPLHTAESQTLEEMDYNVERECFPLCNEAPTVLSFFLYWSVRVQ